MEFRILTFDELDKDTLYDILNLRSRVFVVEQGVRYLDPDGYDRKCMHMLCTEEGELVGYLGSSREGSRSVRRPSDASSPSNAGRASVPP